MYDKSCSATNIHRSNQGSYGTVLILPLWGLPCHQKTFQVSMMCTSLDTDEKCQKTSYVIQFLWRDLSSELDVIGPYFTVSSTMESKILHSMVTKTMLTFVQYGFSVRALLCDGASSNLTLLKLFCGVADDSAPIKPWFKSPFDGKRVFVIVCPSHQVCFV